MTKAESGGQMTGLIRAASAADEEAVRTLVNEAFAVERFLKKGGGDRLQADGELETLFARGRFLLMEEAGAPVACVNVQIRDDRCYMGLLSIAPGRQRSGIGRAMNAAAEAYAREQGCRWVDLRVVSPRREQLVPLYERLGYVETGTEEYPAALAAKMAIPGHFILMSKAL